MFEKTPATAPGIPPVALPIPTHAHPAEQRLSHDELVLTAYIVPRNDEEELKLINGFENVPQERRAPRTTSPVSSANLNFSPRAVAQHTPVQQSDEVSTKARYVICKIQEIQSLENAKREQLARKNSVLQPDARVHFGGAPPRSVGSHRMKLSNVASYGSLASIHDRHPEQAGPVKVIVFSQFFEFLDRVAVDLIQSGIKFERFWGKRKAHALKRFRILNDVRVLLLTKEGSHGLDLSFVTHIFLMDTIEDRALEEQVISRAYRMGSKQSVVVDQVPIVVERPCVGSF